MFRAARCSSSGGQIVLLLHTVRPFTESDDTRRCNDTICPPEDEQGTARNMSRIITQHIEGGSNMTGTDFYVNKSHCAAAVRP